MEDIVANALAVDSDDTANVEKVLARDSNAVKSTVFPEWKKIGALLANEGGGPSPMCYAIQGVCVALGVVDGLKNLAHGALHYIVAVLSCLAFAVATLCVTSARVALMPGGKLDQLGAGEVMVSERDAASNARWRKGLLAYSVGWVLAGLWLISSGSIHTMLFGLVHMTLGPVIFSGWWASMRTASFLCRDASIEVIKDVRATDPKDEEQWDAKVSQPALALREKFELQKSLWRERKTIKAVAKMKKEKVKAAKKKKKEFEKKVKEKGLMGKIGRKKRKAEKKAAEAEAAEGGGGGRKSRAAAMLGRLKPHG